LAFSWLQERKMRKATQSLLRNKRHYPENVINNLLLGETWTRLKQYKQALSVQDEILRIAPTNRQVLYDRGMTYSKMGEIEKAHSAFNAYLASSYLEESQRASAYFRLGRLAARQRNWEQATTQYQRAVKINGHRASKASLERLKKKKEATP
jgi:Flp pilus assembly protein TadD